jgi:5-formyltetrahydrofolate cyclo-ligase
MSVDDKKRLRRAAETARDAAHAAGADIAALALRDHGLAALAGRGHAVIGGYWPMRGEIDIRPLLLALIAAGAEAALPVVTGAGQPLRFRRWRPGQDLVRGAFQTLQPADDQPICAPDLLLVPLLAFDRARQRLGYGGGFYDRTLAALRAAGPVFAVGAAFAAQEVPAVPVDPWDQPLDLILTERGGR